MDHRDPIGIDKLLIAWKDWRKANLSSIIRDQKSCKLSAGCGSIQQGCAGNCAASHTWAYYWNSLSRPWLGVTHLIGVQPQRRRVGLRQARLHLAVQVRIEQVSQGFAGAAGLARVPGAHRRVQPVVATLAERGQVVAVAIFRAWIVQVGDGQHDPRDLVAVQPPCLGQPGVLGVLSGGVVSPDMVWHSAPLAAVAGAVKDGRADRPPVGRVAVAVFTLDRHDGVPGQIGQRHMI